MQEADLIAQNMSIIKAIAIVEFHKVIPTAVVIVKIREDLIITEVDAQLQEATTATTTLFKIRQHFGPNSRKSNPQNIF